MQRLRAGRVFSGGEAEARGRCLRVRAPRRPADARGGLAQAKAPAHLRRIKCVLPCACWQESGASCIASEALVCGIVRLPEALHLPGSPQTQWDVCTGVKTCADAAETYTTLPACTQCKCRR